MSIFDTLFGSNSSESSQQPKTTGIPLTTREQIEAIVQESEQETVVIFKHSTRCSISRMVLKDFELDYQSMLNPVKWYYLDLLNYRDISNELANRFQVEHQSPQVLVIKKGKCVLDASHESIDWSRIIKHI
jgi:bacillithiol system protein YtxJ